MFLCFSVRSGMVYALVWWCCYPQLWDRCWLFAKGWLCLNMEENKVDRKMRNALCFFKKRFYLFTFRERKMEGEREGEKHWCGGDNSDWLPHTPPTGDLACNPGRCPDWELNWWPIGSEAGTQPTESHQPGQKALCFLPVPFHYKEGLSPGASLAFLLSRFKGWLSLVYLIIFIFNHKMDRWVYSHKILKYCSLWLQSHFSPQKTIHALHLVYMERCVFV